MPALLKLATVRLQAELSAPLIARERLEAVCLGFPGSWMVLAKVLITEVVTNALRSSIAEGSSPAGDIHVRIEQMEDLVRIEVRGPQPHAVQSSRSAPALPGSELGVSLVEQLAARSGETVLPEGRGRAVWFELASSQEF